MSPSSANSTWFSRVLLKQFWFRGDARAYPNVIQLQSEWWQERFAALEPQLHGEITVLTAGGVALVQNRWLLEGTQPDGSRRLSIDTVEPAERNMIDEVALRLVHGELPVGS